MKAVYVASKPIEVEGSTAVPEPGPNTREVGLLEYDPDAGLLVFTMPNDVRTYIKFDELDGDRSFDVLLNDTKIGPQVKLTFKNVRLPKFSSPEEAEAWLEENS